MDIQVAVLCDYAADYQGKLCVQGAFDTLFARQFPVIHPACALALRLCLTPEDSGDHKLGISIIGQTAKLVPADKKLYALRDVTSTVPAIPLIVSSIMSKKLAAGADIIILDVKVGSGGFMKTVEDARLLASEMVEVGKAAGRKTVAVMTDMDSPLGSCVGNALEVKEAISALKGETKGDLVELCLTIGANILLEGGIAETEEEARAMLQASIDDGSALKKLAEFVEAQGGDSAAVYDTSLLPEAPIKYEALSSCSGYVKSMQADGIGIVSLHLGGGRVTKESVIDLGVGLVLHKKTGDYVSEGESLATIHASSMEKALAAADMLRACYEFSSEKGEDSPFIKGIVR